MRDKAAMQRPLPPDLPNGGAFMPDQDELGAWARACFIDAGHLLTNPDHYHLQQASIGWLWTNFTASAAGRMIAGEARIPREGGAKWSQAMAAYQIEEWFGHIPNFIITISTEAARGMDDASFCALVEHELYHCSQAVDEYGAPRFNKDGFPVWTIRGHDIEEFVSVVARYGAVDPAVAAIVKAVNAGPTISKANIAAGCGTCNARRAA